MNKPLSSAVRIQKARTTLLLDQPFFGTLLFRLGAQARSSIATMAFPEPGSLFSGCYKCGVANVCNILPALKAAKRIGEIPPRKGRSLWREDSFLNILEP
jgi:hypothetical protein